jgi:hypothetical protein
MIKKLLFLAAVASMAYGDDVSLNRHQFSFGPQVFGLKRERKGGSWQEGVCGGVIAEYQRLKRYGWYVGLAGSLATTWNGSRLQGRAGNEAKLKSSFSDVWVEGRFGYTFQQACGKQASLTPFIGGGYLWETNRFRAPSPLLLHFKTTSPYVLGGFLFWIHVQEAWEVGFNVKIRYPLEPRCSLSHDPNLSSKRQNIRERIHTRLELPITYRIVESGRVALSCVPFYERRRYGSHPNYPIHYLKTELSLWGVAFELLYRL